MKTESIEKLREIIEVEIKPVGLQLLYKDAFAVGCHLHGQGEKAAGRKLCSEVLSLLGYGNRKVYFIGLLQALDGNEDAYASGICAHGEINELGRRKDGKKRLALKYCLAGLMVV